MIPAAEQAQKILDKAAIIYVQKLAAHRKMKDREKFDISRALL